MGHTGSRKADVLFERLYTDVDFRVAQSLLDFRSKNPPKTLVTDGIRWEYISVGDGDSVILFLHGMAGAYDIWWQQIEALRNRYRIISLNYPIADNLEAIRTGINSILHNHGVERCNVVGTSLGGYIAQYLIARQPERIRGILALVVSPLLIALASWLPARAALRSTVIETLGRRETPL